MTYDDISRTNHTLVLALLAKNSHKDFSIEEIKEAAIMKLTNAEIMEILGNFLKSGYVTEIFTVKNLLDLDSKAEIRYKISELGTSKWLQLQSIASRERLAQEDYEQELEDAKKSRRRWLITCSIIFVLAILTVIIVPLVI